MSLHVVVMGVAGSGKTTVAQAIRDRLGFAMAEGDDFHSTTNIAKMSAGIALTDSDRWPWLGAIGHWMSGKEHEGICTVVSCSALKRSYRDRLRKSVRVHFLFLSSTQEVIAQRVDMRKGHFMPEALLPSQFADLEPLEPDEDGCVIDAGGTSAQMVEHALKAARSFENDERGAKRCEGTLTEQAVWMEHRMKGEETMQLGMIGLGRMGGNMAERLRQKGHTVIGFDANPQSHRDVASLEDLVDALSTPRLVWVMVPSGDPTDQTIGRLAGLLEEGDIVVNGGNSKYDKDHAHEKQLAQHGIRFMDCGVSGGIWGPERGYALMVGGDRETFQYLLPVFNALKPEGPDGLVLAGPVGGGHFAKMVHNGIEYGMMQAFGEGFATMNRSELVTDPSAVLSSWRSGSVVSSWLLNLMVQANRKDPDLKSVSAVADESGEAKWMMEAALELGVPTPATAAALYTRQSSRGGADDILRAVTAMRAQFGGHVTEA